VEVEKCGSLELLGQSDSTSHGGFGKQKKKKKKKKKSHEIKIVDST
jgi:hypothetical protein